MKAIKHESASRGHADHGWLNAKHTFSFAGYYDPERVHFGALRVLNDDRIDGGTGFGMHPHDNMEIITIPLSGDLEHKDSMGNTGVIKQGDVQVMSAGTGIYHSEYNKNKDKDLSLLQIWVFPAKRNVTPRYDQRTFDVSERKDKLQVIVSPMGDAEGMHIHQDAWFSIGHLSAGFETTYKVRKPGNGVYVFLISGEAEVAGTKMNMRDGVGISETDEVSVRATAESEILLMEVPMLV